MTWKEAFEQTKNEFIDKDLIVTSIEDAEALHKKFIELKTQLAIYRQIINIMTHYRGEQKFGWDISSGIFRPPLSINDAFTGKDFEKKATAEFERSIHEKIGPHTLRNIFDKEKHGKDWDLLFQAQHAGIRTTLTDWTAEIISALFFATEESDTPEIEKSDAQLWCFIVPLTWIYGHNTYPTRDTFYD